MLSKQDYKEYLDQMLELEEKMVGVYGNLANKVNNQELKKIFTRIKEDEIKHAALVYKMKKIIIEEDN
ncbi:MAG: ferritin-like domain-containing protein [Candidatus Omnitrophota bacterium]